MREGDAVTSPLLKVKMLGIREMQQACDQTARELMEAEDPAALAAGEPIKDKWKGLVPWYEGNYERSLAVAWTGIKGAAVGTAWVPGLPRDEQPFIYSKRLEFGEFGTTAQPSARPAMVAARAEALEAGAEPLRSVIKGRRARRVTT